MMKKISILAAIFAVLPVALMAQVEKQVEVTKAYIPSVGSASKLAITPDMTDTVKMRPDIDYTITPLSLSTNLSTRPIRPATVTYWEFNRPKMTYIKLGAGYPANSLADIYLSSQNRGTGYVVGYLNHRGDYSKVANQFDIKNNSTQMQNRIGLSAGKYLGRRTLEGALSYDNRLYHRYGVYSAPTISSNLRPGQRVDYGDVQAQFRFGDEFVDLSRLNFEVGVSGSLFSIYPELYKLNINGNQPDTKERIESNSHQITIDAHAKIARGFSRHRFTAEIGYKLSNGFKSLDGYNQQILRAGLRYGIDGGVVRLEAGADYYYDKIKTASRSGHYILPFLRLDLNVANPAINPFLELDGTLRDNSYRSLTQLNPYLNVPGDILNDVLFAPTSFINRSSVDYNARLGIGGRVWSDKLSYRLFVGFSVRDNHIYWLNSSLIGQSTAGEATTDFYSGSAMPMLGRQSVTSFNGDLEYRPLSQLVFNLGAHGYLYNDDLNLGNGSPSFEASLGGRYIGRKISFGVSALYQASRKWSVEVFDYQQSENTSYQFLTAPWAIDLRVDFQWHVSRTLTLFAEGRNLGNAKLYDFAFYRSRGAQFTAGLKLNF